MPEGLEPSASGSEGNCHSFEISPGGRLRFDIDATEVRNNEWFEAPTVTDLKTRKVLLSLQHPWDAEGSWVGPNALQLRVGQSRERGSVTVCIDADDGTVRTLPDGEPQPITKTQVVAEGGYRKSRSSLPPLPYPGPPVQNPYQREPINWGRFFLTLGLAALMLGAALLIGYLVLGDQPPDPSPYPPAPTPKTVDY